MMKKIKVFLASSAELDDDKLQVELFVSRKNKDWHAKRLFLELTTWKDFISSMTEERTQNEYNRYIASSDISIFLFHTRLGRYTKEEFDTAHDAFLACQRKVKTPLIYTYFKTVESEAPEITGFRDYIDSLEHFYDTYATMDELFVKLNRQLDKLENEGVIITPEAIDPAKVLKYAVYYFLLPLLVLAGAITSWHYFTPTDLTVRVHEADAAPGLPFTKGTVALTYGDKTDTREITNEAIFKEIPSKHKHGTLQLRFAADGYVPIDTMVETGDPVDLAIRRNNALGVIFGQVRDDGGRPVQGVTITVKDISATTDALGRFRVDIPRAKQAAEQRLTAYKAGYQPWDFTGTPSETVEWKIVLKQ
jgi:hypothetical protein